MDQDIGRLDIAVNDALTMGVIQCGTQLTDQPRNFAGSEWTFARQALPERLAGDIGHDVVQEINARRPTADGRPLTIDLRNP